MFNKYIDLKERFMSEKIFLAREEKKFAFYFLSLNILLVVLILVR